MGMLGTFNELRGIRKAVLRGIPSCMEDSLKQFGAASAMLMQSAKTFED